MSSSESSGTPPLGDLEALAARASSDTAALLDAVATGRLAPETLPAELVQRLLTLGVKAFAAAKDAGDVPFPFTEREAVTPTEVGVTVTHALRAAEIDLFELVLWQGLA